MESSLAQSAVLTAHDVRVQLNGKSILNGITFEVRRGSIVGLVGPNGSGKTTLLRTICQLQPYYGSILLEGQEVRNWPVRRLARSLALVRQAPELSFDFTVEEIVLLGRAPHKGLLSSVGTRDRKLLQSALETVDLGTMTHRRMHTLSGGERQRAYLAQALVQNAGILLLDEPTTHLDVSHQFSFMQVVRSLTDQGRTVVVVFHDLELAARFADQILMLCDGQLVANGTPSLALTAKLIENVFCMRAHVDLPRISYQGPA